MIEKEPVEYMKNTPVGVRAYAVDEYEPHYHSNCLEIIFLLKGEITVLASYDRFFMKEGDFVVLNNGDIHYIKGKGDNLVVSIYMDLEALREKYTHAEFLYYVCESFNLNSLQEADALQLRKILTAVIAEAANDEHNADKIREYAHQIMELLIYRFDLVHYYSMKTIPDNQLERYHRIIKEVEERYGERLELEDIAQKEYLGKNYISQFWKNMTNMNFTEYLNSRRCEKAEKLLLTTDKSINEISLDCGFSDPKYIYKNFRKWYEKTPSAHKKEYEAYRKKGTSAVEYGTGELLSRFGKEFIYASVDEEKADIIRSAETAMSWRKKFENHINKNQGSKLKKEMIRESYGELGIREVYLPLLDEHVVKTGDEGIFIDSDFIKRVFSHVKNMDLIVNIEIELSGRPADMWKKIIASFAAAVSEKELLSRCRFIIYIEELEMAGEAEKVAEALEETAGDRNVKLAFRFD